MLIEQANLNTDEIYRVLVDAGLKPIFNKHNQLLMRSEHGLDFEIRVDTNRSLLVFHTWFPTEFNDELDAFVLTQQNLLNLRR